MTTNTPITDSGNSCFKPEIQLDQSLLKEIDTIELNDRLSTLKERYLDSTPALATERDTLIMESWKDTEGTPIELRCALAIRNVLEGIPVFIPEEELVVGSLTRFFRGAYALINYDSAWALDLLENSEKGQISMGGQCMMGLLSEKDEQALRRNSAYFTGKTTRDVESQVTETLWGNWHDDLTELRGQAPYQFAPPGYGITYYDDVFAKGLLGIAEEAEKKLQSAQQMSITDPEKIWFWQSVIIVCEGMMDFASRYAQHARILAAVEEDIDRQAELKEIARVCENIPANPPRTFHEAVQTVAFVELAKVLENGRIGDYAGRLDQCLYPYFKKDIQEGRISIAQAADLIGGLIAHFARREQCAQVLMREGLQATKISNITLAGLTRDGNDASNELTALFLHMAGLQKYAEPHFSFTWHQGTPQWAMMKALETNVKTGAGHPQFLNGDHVVNYLIDREVPIEDARDHAYLGCAYAHPKNQGHHCKGIQYLNLPLMLDLALHNGVGPITGKKIGIETGNPETFQTFDDVMAAFTKQIEYMLNRLIHRNHIAHAAELTTWRVPLHSVFAINCVENGYDILMGGQFEDPAQTPIWDVIDRGYVNTADSLTAIKQLVFDEKKLTMSELIDALDSNFEGHSGEEIRNTCLEAPKFGNDNDDADYMVRDIAKIIPTMLESARTPFGSKYTINRQGLAWHYYGGKGVGALPDGRKSGEPLADGSLSPTQGADTLGPTAVSNSIWKADFKEARTGVLNQKFSLDLFQDEAFIEKLASFTEVFLSNGGSHIQYNLLDPETLKEAKKYPVKYRDLIVRVAGYSAYFVLLSPEVQDEIIARSEQTL